LYQIEFHLVSIMLDAKECLLAYISIGGCRFIFSLHHVHILVVLFKYSFFIKILVISISYVRVNMLNCNLFV
jgi:hypothetical protein